MSGANSPEVGPDHIRVEKLTNMEPPVNQKQDRSFLGLVNQLSKFLSDYAHNTTKIRSFLHKNTKFIWSNDHQDEFNTILDSLSNLDKLEPYNPEKKYLLTC